MLWYRRRADYRIIIIIIIIRDINSLIYTAATIIPLTMNEPSKGSKNTGNVKCWKIIMKKQISSPETLKQKVQAKAQRIRRYEKKGSPV
jgi:hypothetical protein